MWSDPYVVPATTFCSEGGLLTLFPSSTMGFLPWETVLCNLLQYDSFPQAAVLYELLQLGSLPWGAVSQEQTAPAWVFHGVISPASKSVPAWTPLSTGPQVLPGAWSSAGFPLGQSLLHASICSSLVTQGFRGISALPWTSMGSRVRAYHTMVFFTSCRGLSALAPGTPAPPTSPLTWV